MTDVHACGQAGTQSGAVQAGPTFLRRGMAIALVALVSFAAGCGDEAVGPPPPIVQVMDVAASEVELSAELIGQLDSPQNVEVRARVEAFVEKMLFTEGTEVKEGDPLFALDNKPYKEALAAAKGELAEAKAALSKYENDVKRLTPLAEKRAIPRQDLDDAVAALAMGKASVLSAEAKVESAQFDIDYCDVRAPASGLIGATEVSVGELVGAGEPTLLATLSTLDPVWFYGSISEAQYLKAESEAKRRNKRLFDLPVQLILGDGAVHPQQGKFVFIDRAVDVKTGTLRVRAEFSNPTKLLRPGMFGRIKVSVGAQADSLLIPERAVISLQGKNFVWLVGADSTVSQRQITVGDRIGSDFLVLEGLSPGNRIVVEGLQKVREGAQVQAMTAEQIAKASAAPAAKAKGE